MDELRIYDHALTAEEVLDLMEQVPEDPPPPNPHAVTTFASIGLYWSPDGGGTGTEAQVKFRPLRGGPEAPWARAQSLWFDPRSSQEEYRGSIVELEPATPYEIELSLADGSATDTLYATTWSEDFPVAEVIELPAYSTESLELTRSGTPDGYIVYAPAEGSEAVIDAADTLETCVDVRASYVILRGLTCVNGAINGVRLLSGAHDVVIEECDITNWGRIDGGGPGDTLAALDGAIGGWSYFVERIIAQRNRLHHPRGNSNTWDHGHPYGPYAIQLDSNGNNVFRYNFAYSDSTHYFHDVMGGSQQRIPDGLPLTESRGFPGADSDIYGNALSQCWDDAIESEGSNRNVRIWGNFTTFTNGHIGTAPVELGPIYIWRNISSVGMKTFTQESSGFLKTDCDEPYGCGASFVYHNTMLMPRGLGESGANRGLGGGSPVVLLTSRNNVLHNLKMDDSPGRSITFDEWADENDYDYDLYAGNIPVDTEPNGIDGSPTYAEGAPTFSVHETGIGNFQLAPESLGFDEALLLPNFNDRYQGAGPDMGAHEAGAPPMEFGVDAYRRAPVELSVFVKDVPGCVEQGDALQFIAGVDNLGDAPAAFNRANLTVHQPSEATLPLYDGRDISVDPGQSIATRVQQPVPDSARPGMYQLSVDLYDGDRLLSSQGFEVEVSAICP